MRSFLGAIVGCAAGVPLLLCGLLTTPTGPSTTWDPENVTRGETVECRAERWIPIQVPSGMNLSDFLEAYRLRPKQRAFRTTDGPHGENLDEQDVVNHRGPLWMAAGPPPVRGPGEEDGDGDGLP